MNRKGFLSPIFKNEATPSTSSPAVIDKANPFLSFIADEYHFSDQALGRIVETLRRLRLPVPATNESFMDGSEGALLLSNKRGVSIRIESKNYQQLPFDRINDDPDVTQPIASIDLGDVVVEICPGLKTTNDRALAQDLKDRLLKRNINLFDIYALASNVGIVPYITPETPNGVCVVLDRLSVRREGGKVIDLSDNGMVPVLDPEWQDKYYGPLREAFQAAWQSTDPAKMDQFWQMCETWTNEGKLIAGWNANADNQSKAGVAKTYAKNYDAESNTAVSSAAAEVIRPFI